MAANHLKFVVWQGNREDQSATVLQPGGSTFSLRCSIISLLALALVEQFPSDLQVVLAFNIVGHELGQLLVCEHRSQHVPWNVALLVQAQ